MTEKEGFKVTNISENGNTGLFWIGKDNISVYDVVRLVNDLLEENEQLKIQLQNTSTQRDEFHHGARENANRVGELEKENRQLKEEIEQYKAVIDTKWSKYLKKHEMI